MKKSVLLTVSVLMAISGSMAFASGTRAAEVRSRFEKEVKEGQRRVADPAQASQVRQDVTNHLGQLGANETDLRIAISKTLVIKDGSTDTNVDLLASGRALVDAQKVVTALDADVRQKRIELDAEATALFTEQVRAVKEAADFLASAKSVSNNPLPAVQDQVSAYAKQLSLLPEMFSTMDAVELKSHVDVLADANKIMRSNPEMNGDVAYAEALKLVIKNKNPGISEQTLLQKVAAKFKEIIGCARG